MKQIEKRIYDIELLRDITSQILDWDYGAVIGESIYSKIEKYAHIGIRIYPVESSRSEIVWNVKETEIPKDFYIEIETVLSFFNNYVIALKGKSDKKLAFEIFNCSFNYDSNRNSFSYATIRAIVNCFDKSQFNICDDKKERIQNNKENAINILKEYAKCFNEKEIIESLLNEELTEKISNILDFNDSRNIHEFLKQNNNYELVEQVRKKFLKEKQYFIDNKILTRYEDLSRICYAHFCKLFRQKEYLKYVGVFDLEKIDKYF